MTVSALTGRRQAIWLRGAIRLLALLALLGVLVPGTLGTLAAGLAVVVLISTPLVRVIAIVVRLALEHDTRFVLVGVGLLSAVAVGVLISIFLQG